MPPTPTRTRPAPATYFVLALPRLQGAGAPPGAWRQGACEPAPSIAPAWTRVTPALARVLAVDEADLCFYHRVRIPGGHVASATNELIADFKESPAYMEARPAARVRKQAAIRLLADAVAGFLARPDVAAAVALFAPVALVPMPTHLPKSHPLHDMRLSYLCALAAARAGNVHLADAFDVRAEADPAHLGGTRSPRALKAQIALRPLATPEGPPRLAILVDDVITTGAHFAACRDLVHAQRPGLPVIGLFLSIHRSAKVDYPVPL